MSGHALFGGGKRFEVVLLGVCDRTSNRCDGGKYYEREKFHSSNSQIREVGNEQQFGCKIAYQRGHSPFWSRNRRAKFPVSFAVNWKVAWFSALPVLVECSLLSRITEVRASFLTIVILSRSGFFARY